MCRAQGGTLPAGGLGSNFKRHSEAYAQSICIHDLMTFVSLIYENIMARCQNVNIESYINYNKFKNKSSPSHYNDTSRE